MLILPFMRNPQFTFSGCSLPFCSDILLSSGKYIEVVSVEIHFYSEIVKTLMHFNYLWELLLTYTHSKISLNPHAALVSNEHIKDSTA